jgi:putative transposase
MKIYPARLHHKTPPWVADAAIFHIRIRCDRQNQIPLTNPEASRGILASVVDYADRQKWSCYVFLLMPDHLHALISFGRDLGMGETIRNWKRARTKFQGIAWQEGFFDHRIRTAA